MSQPLWTKPLADLDVTIHDELDSVLEREWLDLQDAAASWHPMLHPDFLRAAIAMARPDSTPMILAARSQGRLLGVLALGSTLSRIGPFTLRRVRPISAGRHDLSVVLACPEDMASVSHAFGTMLERLRRRGREVVLYGVPSAAPLLGHVPLDFKQRASGPLWFADLGSAASWEDVILVPHQKRDIRRREKLLIREHGRHTVAWATDADQALAMTREFVALHAAQQLGKGRTSAFAPDAAASGLATYLAGAVPVGAADISALRMADGRVLASEILLYSRDVAYRYRTTYDMSWSRYGPGNLLLAASVDRVIGRGYSTFELGWGIEPYKANWGRAAGEVCRVLAAPPRHRGFGYRLIRRLRQHREAGAPA